MLPSDNTCVESQMLMEDLFLNGSPPYCPRQALSLNLDLVRLGIMSSGDLPISPRGAPHNSQSWSYG